MMKRSQVFPSNYFGKGDVEEGPVTGAIASVTMEPIKSDNGEESKAVLHFTARLRPFILNLCNWTTLETSYGEDSDSWTGKHVEMYFDPTVMYGKERVGGVRVRIPKLAENKFSASALNGAIADLMTLEQAKQECAAVGIPYESMVAELKKRGQLTWNSANCSPIVREMIAHAKHAAEGLLDRSPEESIPF
jgi:hypothetical protein